MPQLSPRKEGRSGAKGEPKNMVSSDHISRFVFPGDSTSAKAVEDVKHNYGGALLKEEFRTVLEQDENNASELVSDNDEYIHVPRYDATNKMASIGGSKMELQAKKLRQAAKGMSVRMKTLGACALLFTFVLHIVAAVPLCRWQVS